MRTKGKWPEMAQQHPIDRDARLRELEEAEARRLAYQQAYRQRADVKAKHLAYQQRHDVKAKRRAKREEEKRLVALARRIESEMMTAAAQ